MRKLRYLVITVFLFTLSTGVHSQDGSKESRVGVFMRSNERSYVVIAVMLTILAGLILYVIRLDRKLSKLEKEK